MPRLSTQRYLAARRSLRGWWLEEHRVFACLTPDEQWQLHDFFKLSWDLNEPELRAHRKAVSQERPSLPHLAGKALTKFEARATGHMMALRAQRHAPARKTKRAEKILRLQLVVNPEPDLAKVVIAIARHLAQQQRDDKDVA